MASDERVNEIERWFVQRGVPHLVENDNDDTILDTWSDIGFEIRQILAVRTAYHVAQGAHPTSSPEAQ